MLNWVSEMLPSGFNSWLVIWPVLLPIMYLAGRGFARLAGRDFGLMRLMNRWLVWPAGLSIAFMTCQLIWVESHAGFVQLFLDLLRWSGDADMAPCVALGMIGVIGLVHAWLMVQAFRRGSARVASKTRRQMCRVVRSAPGTARDVQERARFERLLNALAKIMGDDGYAASSGGRVLQFPLNWELRGRSEPREAMIPPVARSILVPGKRTAGDITRLMTISPRDMDMRPKEPSSWELVRRPKGPPRWELPVGERRHV